MWDDKFLGATWLLIQISLANAPILGATGPQILFISSPDIPQHWHNFTMKSMQMTTHSTVKSLGNLWSQKWLWSAVLRDRDYMNTTIKHLSSAILGVHQINEYRNPIYLQSEIDQASLSKLVVITDTDSMKSKLIWVVTELEIKKICGTVAPKIGALASENLK